MVREVNLKPLHIILISFNNNYRTRDLAHALCDTIADYLFKDRTPYARLTTVIINISSRTGKSRMVDQLGT